MAGAAGDCLCCGIVATSLHVGQESAVIGGPEPTVARAFDDVCQQQQHCHHCHHHCHHTPPLAFTHSKGCVHSAAAGAAQILQTHPESPWSGRRSIGPSTLLSAAAASSARSDGSDGSTSSRGDGSVMTSCGTLNFGQSSFVHPVSSYMTLTAATATAAISRAPHERRHHTGARTRTIAAALPRHATGRALNGSNSSTRHHQSFICSDLDMRRHHASPQNRLTRAGVMRLAACRCKTRVACALQVAQIQCSDKYQVNFAITIFVHCCTHERCVLPPASSSVAASPDLCAPHHRAASTN